MTPKPTEVRVELTYDRTIAILLLIVVAHFAIAVAVARILGIGL